LYSVEFEKDSAVITVLSEDDSQEDVEVIIGDNDVVFVRQYQEYKNEYDVIVMTWQQLKDIAAAINSPEGLFRLVRR
jgi:predicted ATP-grasp superfamily ATP-dependent carboligase